MEDTGLKKGVNRSLLIIQNRVKDTCLHTVTKEA